MTWKLYTLASAGAFVATFFVTVPPQSRQSAVAPRAQATDNAGPIIDLTEQADRLHVRIAQATEYREPSRNAFRFGERAGRAAERAALEASEALTTAVPVVALPVRPQFALVGMASSVEDGVTQRTAILSSLRGVQLVKVGDVIDSGYTVVAIAENALTIESTSDGSKTEIRLPDSDPR